MDIFLLHGEGIPEGSFLSIQAGQLRREVLAEKGQSIKFPKGAASCGEITVQIVKVLGEAKLALPSLNKKYVLEMDQKHGRRLSCELEIRRPAELLGNDQSLGVNPQSPPSPTVKTPNSTSRNSGTASSSASRRLGESLSTQQYMDKHSLAQIMQAVLKTTVKNRPSNPLSYMAQQLQAAEFTEGDSGPTPSQSRKSSKAPSAGSLSAASNATHYKKDTGTEKSTLTLQEISPQSVEEVLASLGTKGTISDASNERGLDTSYDSGIGALTVYGSTPPFGTDGVTPTSSDSTRHRDSSHSSCDITVSKPSSFADTNGSLKDSVRSLVPPRRVQSVANESIATTVTQITEDCEEADLAVQKMAQHSVETIIGSQTGLRGESGIASTPPRMTETARSCATASASSTGVNRERHKVVREALGNTSQGEPPPWTQQAVSSVSQSVASAANDMARQNVVRSSMETVMGGFGKGSTGEGKPPPSQSRPSRSSVSSSVSTLACNLAKRREAQRSLQQIIDGFDPCPRQREHSSVAVSASSLADSFSITRAAQQSMEQVLGSLATGEHASSSKMIPACPSAPQSDTTSACNFAQKMVAQETMDTIIGIGDCGAHRPHARRQPAVSSVTPTSVSMVHNLAHETVVKESIGNCIGGDGTPPCSNPCVSSVPPSVTSAAHVAVTKESMEMITGTGASSPPMARWTSPTAGRGCPSITTVADLMDENEHTNMRTAFHDVAAESLQDILTSGHRPPSWKRTSPLI
mmetsp:Transcript_19604/g.55105  ORF Transcript_19604/g.55105 Transcript_19604/m.55105 type:complete len:751 (-) Transcript_19604:188-2440(-)